MGYRIDAPLPVPHVFELIAERGGVEAAELYEVFNMGCGFVCVVPAAQVEAAVELLSAHHPGAAVIGEVTDGTAWSSCRAKGSRPARSRVRGWVRRPPPFYVVDFATAWVDNSTLFPYPAINGAGEYHPTRAPTAPRSRTA